ncbi:MAG: AAA family ATPase, partial [Mycobacterium sp.]|nr:AAA family ATPase [Mycobacterium sp.]
MTTVRVLGGPGTGKTTMLVAAAADRIADGLAPDSVLLLTSAKLAAGTRAALTSRMLRAAGADLPAVREPLVRPAPSYAFAGLGTAAERAGDPRPR